MSGSAVGFDFSWGVNSAVYTRQHMDCACYYPDQLEGSMRVPMAVLGRATSIQRSWVPSRHETPLS